MQNKKLRKECTYRLIQLFFNLEANDRIPPISKLAEILDCSIGQVRTMMKYLRESNYVYTLGNNCYLPNKFKLEYDKQFTVQLVEDGKYLELTSSNHITRFNYSELGWVLDFNHLKIDDIRLVEMIVYLIFEFKFTYKNYTKMTINAIDNNIWMSKQCYQVGTNILLYSVSATRNRSYIDYYL